MQLSRSPVIGVTACSTLDDYLESIRRVGGEPQVIDVVVNPGDALQAVDGLLLTGGEDIDPARYGEVVHPATGPINARRDELELELVVLALASGLPILAICRGIQVLNVACGGSLVQDIADEVPGALNHKLPKHKDIAHDIWVNRGSRLWTILQERLDAHDACPVNSRHHQALKRVAVGFEPSATAPDGVIEAIERTGEAFCIGVQWHPENFWRTGEFRPLFEAFVASCLRKGVWS